ncbi:MAG: transcription-repair coupling factor [Bacteroidales bacterium]|nr:transcription-repair coupling factor [Bacteroidales bacterium]MCB9012976.1 transcription-repair coupling factor [Bacteroidales bacterium]
MLGELYKDRHEVSEITALLQEAGGKFMQLKGLSGSSRSAFIHACLSQAKGTHLIILPEKEEAAYFYNDLTSLDKGSERSLFFPSSYVRSIQYKKTDDANIITRTQVLKRLGEKRVASFVVTYPEALMERVISRKGLDDNTFEMKEGEKVSREFLRDLLETYKFELVDFVYEPGQYALRGSIIDIFSYSSTHPHRIDFFGEEIESIRSFDIETQLSLEKTKKINIIPNIQWERERLVKRVSFFEYLPKNTTVWTENLDLIFDRIDDIYEKTSFEDEKDKTLVKSEVIVNSQVLNKDISPLTKIEFGGFNLPGPSKVIQFRTSPQPVFNKNFDLLVNDLRSRKEEGYSVMILSESEKQIERLSDIFREIDSSLSFIPVLKTLHQGFIDHDLKICLYTDHEIFERYHKFQIHDRYSKKEAISIKELSGLSPGDFIVHVDHGIGIFGGLETIDINGKKQESVRLVYRDQDVIYVSIHNLHRISKYKGKEGDAPRIYKLGTGAWQKLKQTTKKKIKDIAADLIKLYAVRKQQEGFRFSPDTYLQRELEASFIYEDTPDQVKATKDVKEGMEAEFPMDRLVCGDVGFGKTEVAIRAAFKAVTDSKQVAVLVPTTILAFQHYNTFRDRLKDFPCNVDYLSRFRKPADQKIILQKLAKGEIDILIGTHKLVGKEIKFRDLGLLIIDEEQKFGVSVKEKLRELKLNVDTLTLTATPIPRTLQFSLMGARDLSIINTPPPNRHPIITELHVFNEDIIREAIEYEINRGGQVFFINNRIQNIYELEILIRKICKSARVVVAHGQMEGTKLEKTMLDFIQGDYDVLIATSIIESGLDIPNANTIIINNAHHFGLSDLHQLRGRVGRSNKKAFCYLLAPPVTMMTNEARRRMRAIEEFSELGSGFNIAMQDLDIRGSGNLLGAEQSGFIADIGYETYQRILNEAILELRENEFKYLYPATEEEKESRQYVSDCQIDTDLELLFPDHYINNVSERIRLYRELDVIPDEEGLAAFEKNLVDRFGPVPDETVELLNVVRLRWLALKLGMEKIIIKNSLMLIYFIQDPESAYYQSGVFSAVLNFVQRMGRNLVLKEENKRLSLKIPQVKSVKSAIDTLNKIMI